MSEDANKPENRGWILPLAVPFLVIPLCYRCAWILRQDGVSNLSQAVRFVPQDLFAGWEFLAITIAATLPFRAFRKDWQDSRLASASICFLVAAAATLAQLLLLVDFVVQNKTGVRVETGFLRFLVWADTVWASITSAVGIPLLLCVAAGAVLYFAWTCRIVWTRREAIRFSWLIPASGPVLYFVAILATRSLPAESYYDSANVIFNLQRELVQSWQSESPELPNAETVENLLRPANESFVRETPGYPLLKWTSGFHGEKDFELPMQDGERPHILFLLLESFRARDIGALGSHQRASPHFDRLAETGVLFSNFYANGVQTSRTTMSALFGSLPSYHFRSVQADNPKLRLIGIADLLKPAGYHSAFLTGTPLEFENQGDFFLHHDFDSVLGEDWVGSTAPKTVQKTSWGYHDEYLMTATVDWLAEKDRQKTPVFATILTVTNHDPWSLPDGYQPPDFPNASSEEHARFLRTFHYTDHCLGLFMEQLEARGLAEKCIIFVTADTGCPRGEHDGNMLLVQYLYEENMHVPLLILAPGRLQEPKQIDSPASHVDLMPTVMDLLSLTGWNHSVGSSLVRSNSDRTVWMNNPFALGYVGLRRGFDKFIDAPRRQQSQLFDLQSDPDEQMDRSRTKPELVEKYRQQISGVNGVFRALYATERMAPQKLPPPPKTKATTGDDLPAPGQDRTAN